MANNYILFDGPPSKEFMRGLKENSHKEWHALSCDGRANVAKWRRLLNYFVFPLRFLLGHREIGQVVAWQQFYGITTAFYNSLLPLHKGMDISIMTFIYKAKEGMAGRLFHKYVCRAINSRNVSQVIVFSRSEVEHYSRLFPQVAEKFRYIPLGIPDPIHKPESTTGDYIFTTGMSNRDYDFLCNALAGTQYKVKIACPGVNVPRHATNIEVLNACYDDDMIREMAGCRTVVIPLRDRNISSGQLVLLQAMQLGKPVIVTRTDALSTYVEDGRTAIFIDNDKEQLLKVLDALYSDKDLYLRLSSGAAEKAREFSEYNLGANIARLTD